MDMEQARKCSSEPLNGDARAWILVVGAFAATLAPLGADAEFTRVTIRTTPFPTYSPAISHGSVDSKHPCCFTVAL